MGAEARTSALQLQEILCATRLHSEKRARDYYIDCRLLTSQLLSSDLEGRGGEGRGAHLVLPSGWALHLFAYNVLPDAFQNDDLTTMGRVDEL